MNKIKLSPQDLLEHLKEQNIMLLNSINAYRKGDHCEAKRIAHRVRVLIKNDTKNSNGLVQQLCACYKDLSFYVLSRQKYSPPGKGVVGYFGYTMDFSQNKQNPLNINTELADRQFQNKINDWLKEIACIIEGHEITKEDVLWIMVDQDGGAHVDPSIKPEYDSIKKMGAFHSGTTEYDHLREAVYDYGISVLISSVLFYEEITKRLSSMTSEYSV